MGKGVLTGLIVLLLTLAAWDGAAEIYQWVDNEGITHASNDPGKVPPAYRGRVESLSLSPSGRMVDDGAAYAIPFEKGPSGVMFVQVFLNNVIRARMVFDTGASLVLISPELAQRLGQTASEPAGGKIRLKTAGGDVEGRSMVISRVDLGDAVKENVRAAVGPQNQTFDDFDGLLGLSFLEDFQVTIDHRTQEVILRRQSR